MLTPKTINNEDLTIVGLKGNQNNLTAISKMIETVPLEKRVFTWEIWFPIQ